MRLKEMATSRKDSFLIPLEQLREDPKNPRTDYTNVPDLAASMFCMGQLEDCEVRVEYDVAVFTAGHRRFRAAKYCNEHYDEWLADARKGDPSFIGHRFDGLMCKSEPRDITELDRTFRQLNQGDQSTQAVPLNPIELARTYKRLVEQGVSMAEIGRRVHKSAQQVANTLCLIEAPKELQDAVERGETSATAVSRVTKASPEKQAEAVESAKKHEKIKVKDTAEYVPLTPKQFTSSIKKADGYLQAAKSKEEQARWGGVVRGLRIGAGYETLE